MRNRGLLTGNFLRRRKLHKLRSKIGENYTQFQVTKRSINEACLFKHPLLPNLYFVFCD